MKLLAIIREKIRSNPVLYRVWLRIRGIKKDLPGRQSLFFVDGFQRSGNTFASNIFAGLFPGQHIASHFHAIAAVKIAIGCGLPTIILVRNPFDCLRSSISKRTQEFNLWESVAIAWDLHGYERYYRFCLKNQRYVRLVLFEELVKDPARVTASVVRGLLGIELDPALIQRVVAGVYVDMEADGRPGAARNFPSTDKDLIKSRFNEVIKGPEYIRCVAIYQELLRVARQSPH